MLTGVHGLAALLVAGIPVEAPPGGAFSWPSNGTIGPFSVPLVLAVAGFAVLAILLRRTALGRVWFLVGSNPEAARTAGLRVRLALFLAYVVGAAFVAVAGVILTARVHSGQPDLYPTLAFEAIAACAIGGLSLNGGVGRVTGVIVGVLIVALTANGVVLLNLSADFQLMIVGALTVASVLAARRRTSGRAWRLRRAPMGQTPSTQPAAEERP
jgi:ribose transport system permease protein